MVNSENDTSNEKTKKIRQVQVNHLLDVYTILESRGMTISVNDDRISLQNNSSNMSLNEDDILLETPFFTIQTLGNKIMIKQKNTRSGVKFLNDMIILS